MFKAHLGRGCVCPCSTWGEICLLQIGYLGDMRSAGFSEVWLHVLLQSPLLVHWRTACLGSVEGTPPWRCYCPCGRSPSSERLSLALRAVRVHWRLSDHIRVPWLLRETQLIATCRPPHTVHPSTEPATSLSMQAPRSGTMMEYGVQVIHGLKATFRLVCSAHFCFVFKLYLHPHAVLAGCTHEPSADAAGWLSQVSLLCSTM